MKRPAYSSTQPHGLRRFPASPKLAPLPELPATEQEALFGLLRGLSIAGPSHCNQWRNAASDVTTYINQRLEATIF